MELSLFEANCSVRGRGNSKLYTDSYRFLLANTPHAPAKSNPAAISNIMGHATLPHAWKITAISVKITIPTLYEIKLNSFAKGSYIRLRFHNVM